MRRSLAITSLTEAIVLISYFLTFQSVASHLGTPAFEQYVLARRVLSLLFPLAVLGMDVAVTRQAAMEEASARRGTDWVWAGLILVIGQGLLLGLVCLLLTRPLAYLFFGSASYSTLLDSLPLLMIGMAVQGVVYGSLRGGFRVVMANLLMALTFGAIPLVAVFSPGGSVPIVLTATGAAWLAVSLLFVLGHRPNWRALRARIVTLGRYGLPRVPGDVVLLALFAAPPVLLTHVADLSVAAAVGFGMTIVRLAGSLLAPVTFFVLPHAARGFAQGEIHRLRTQVIRLAVIAIPALALGTVVIELLSLPLLSVIAKSALVPHVAAIRIVAASLFPWGIFIVLRGITDARFRVPVSTLCAALSLAVFLATAILLSSRMSVSDAVTIAFTASVYVLGLAIGLAAALAVTLQLENPEVPAVVQRG